LLWLLLAAYVLGASAPGVGLRLRELHVGSAHALGSAGAVSLPMLLLASLLLIAGLSAELEEVGKCLRRPGLLIVLLGANATYPVVFASIAAVLLMGWHDGHEAQNILVGLAMVGAMPIAGASTAWSQNADGNLALSLGLVWGSTLASPLLTPLGLHVVGFLTAGDYSEDLHRVARQGSALFVIVAVVLPSFVGMGTQVLVGKRLRRAKPALTLASLFVLLLLNYVNAAISLPRMFSRVDIDFIALLIVVMTAMCAGAFALGWWIPRSLRASRRDQTAAMFGMGMNNNGTGLVLAAEALPDHPVVLVVIIVYNLVQQILAGVVDAFRRRR